jgi:peptidoglycan/xylan/chitin deacetylase (PgdA/CDA1 family)
MTRWYFSQNHTRSRIIVKSIAMIVCTILLANIIVISISQRVQAAATAKCNCVIWRLDDIQDYFVSTAQIAVIDHFIANHQKLSGVAIMNSVGNDTTIINEVKKGLSSGTLEIGSEGWSHVDYSKLPAKTQLDTLQKSKQKIIRLWGVTPNLFVPPFNAYSNNTLAALKSLNFKIISAEFGSELPSIYNPSHPASPNNKIYKATVPNSDLKDSYGMYHLPQAIGFYTFGFSGNSTGSIVKTPLTAIESKIDSTIATYGYAVVTLYPDEFAVNFGKGTPQNKVSASAMADLDTLLRYVTSKGYTTKTFSEVISLSAGGSIISIADSARPKTWEF